MPLPCGHCRGKRPAWQIDSLVAPFVYAEPLASFLKALKYRGRREFAPALGRLLANCIAGADLAIDSVVAVPLHPKRLRVRTFNQAHELTLALSQARDYRWRVRSGVRRVVNTPPQTEQSRGERQLFAASSFSVRGKFRGEHVAIVDDVITTGATVNALATALKQAGAAKILALAVARSIGGSAVDQAARNT